MWFTDKGQQPAFSAPIISVRAQPKRALALFYTWSITTPDTLALCSPWDDVQRSPLGWRLPCCTRRLCWSEWLSPLRLDTSTQTSGSSMVKLSQVCPLRPDDKEYRLNLYAPVVRRGLPGHGCPLDVGV